MKVDPSNSQWQRDLSISHGKIGDVQVAQGELPAAVTSYRASLTIAERVGEGPIPATPSGSATLILSYVKLSEATGDKAYVTRALYVALDMQQRGILAPRDAWMIEDLKRRASL